MSVPYFSGSAYQGDAELAPDGVSIRPNVTAHPGSRGLILDRLNILVQLYVLEGGDGDCPDETDTDLVEGNALQ